jgi:homoserine dehydrogenase
MGFGTVGAGVAEVLQTNAALIEQRVGERVNLKYILDVRDFPGSPFADKVIHDFSIIENDPEVDVVAETIGGAKVAYDYTRRLLSAGKHVVTSNKELVATKGCELLELAKEKNVNYLFEASVGGGIPVLRPMVQCLAANDITEIFGILNGTTNYILTRMVRAGATFEAALKEAQEMGYAEQDPTADVEGHDACRKICILSDLAFGCEVPPEKIYTEGISHVTLRDVEIVERARWRVKLLGHALRGKDGKIRAFVAPHLVAAQHPLAAVEDVFNAIMVRGNAVGEVLFYGPGAGKLPTASAVVADIMDAAQHRQKRRNIGWTRWDESKLGKFEELEMRCYFRVKDSLARVEELFPGSEILMCQEGEVAFLTPPMPRAEMDKKAEQLQLCARLCVLD